MADYGNFTIRKVTPAGGVTTLAGLAWSPGNADGTGSAARFKRPRGVTVDGAGNVYVADSGDYVYYNFKNNTIRKGWPASGGVGVAINSHPRSQTAPAGANVALNVSATGTGQLFYQWRRNGAVIPGKTDGTLTLNSVSPFDSDGYSVVVWNQYGSVVSDTAYLAVLTDGANGRQPAQLSTPPPAARPPAQDSLVIVTHGWQPVWESPLGPPPIPSWVTTLSDAIRDRVPDNWSVRPFGWTQAAWSADPDLAIITGAIVGTLYGQQLAQQQWQHVHLIGHSAGAAVIEAIAHALQSSPNAPTVHSTFLDPYTGMGLRGRVVYGNNADWADCYFAHDNLTTIFTEGRLDKAYNVNVTWADPNKTLTPVYCATPSSPDSTPMMEVPCGQNASSSHDWPHSFYLATVLRTEPGCTAGYGFPFSKEGGEWESRGSRPVGNDPLVLCGPSPLTQNLCAIAPLRLCVESFLHGYGLGVVTDPGRTDPPRR